MDLLLLLLHSVTICGWINLVLLELLIDFAIINKRQDHVDEKRQRVNYELEFL